MDKEPDINNQPIEEEPVKETPIATEEKPAEKEWKEYKQEIENLREQVYQKAEKILGEDNGGDWVYWKIQDFTQEVYKNILNYSSFVAWHRLIGSSTRYESAPWLDMPSPCSVKDFCNKLLQELNNKENCLKYLLEKESNKK